MSEGTNADVAGAISRLYRSNRHQDVTFKIEYEFFYYTLKAHKLVLSMWSPVFEDSLRYENEILIDDVKPSHFTAMIEFLYGFEETFNEHKSDVEFLIGVHNAAVKYEIEELKKVCCNYLNSVTVKVTNVFELLEAATHAHLKSKEACIHILKTKTTEILNAYDIKKVTSFMINTVLNLNELSLTSEYDLVSWVYKWAEEEYEKEKCNLEKNEVSDSNLHRKIICEFLPYLHFALLEADQFATLVNKHRDFFDDKEGFKIFMNISCPNTVVKLPCWYSQGKVSRIFNGLIDYNDRESDENDKYLESSLEPETVSCCNYRANETICPSDEFSQSSDVSIQESNDVSIQESNDVSIPESNDVSIPESNDVSIQESTDVPILQSNESDCIQKRVEMPTAEIDDESKWFSLPEPIFTRKKIMRKKVKRTYLISGDKAASNFYSWNSERHSSDLVSLVNEIWKQRLCSTAA